MMQQQRVCARQSVHVSTGSNWKRTPTGHPDTEGGLYLDPLDLVGGGLALPAVQGAVHGVEVLADPLLARDRSALLRRDDLALDGRAAVE